MRLQLSILKNCGVSNAANYPRAILSQVAVAGRTRRCSVARTNRYSKKLLRRNGGRNQRRRDGDVRDGDDGPEGSDGAFAQVLGDMRVFF